MEFTKRQRTIIEMLKAKSPLTGEEIAGQLGLSVPTIRGDLRLLTAVEVLAARPKVGYVYRGENQAGVDYKTLYDHPISTIMQPAAVIKDNATLQDAISKLFLQDVGSLYVVDASERLVGVISRKDLLRASFNNANPSSILASVIMTRMPNIVTVTADMKVNEVGQLLLKHKVDSLPVVDKDSPQTVIGKITKNRLFQHFMTYAKEEWSRFSIRHYRLSVMAFLSQKLEKSRKKAWIFSNQLQIWRYWSCLSQPTKSDKTVP